MQSGTVITIDGPVGSGKSTVARRIAGRLGFAHIDTGAMYRAVALLAVREQVALADAKRLEVLAHRANITFEPGTSRVLLDGEDVTSAIRRPEVSDGSSRVSVFSGVRRALVEKQRALAKSQSVVMEGRDIGTVVFPDAEVKIFLDASPRVRAERRARELQQKGIACRVEQIEEEIRQRDERDRTRADSPLVAAADAVHVDTTAMSLDEVEQAILKVISGRIR